MKIQFLKKVLYLKKINIIDINLKKKMTINQNFNYIRYN